jgi:hypothetical protein
MPLDLDWYGDIGLFLKERKWMLVPTNDTRGTASCDIHTKMIYIKPTAFSKPTTRIRRYVVLHELYHALHAEIEVYDVTALVQARHLEKWSAVEVIADAGCLVTDRSPLMRRWVTASVAWHGRMGYHYSMRDVTSPEAINHATALRLAARSRRADASQASQAQQAQ